MNFSRIAPVLFLFAFIPNFAVQADGCLYTPDHCESTSWSHKIEGGNIISYISVSGNVLTLTLKTSKRDDELSRGMRKGLEDKYICDRVKIHEFDEAHNFIYHPTHSRNHIHYPFFRDLFPFLPIKLNICASIYVEKMLNRFQIGRDMVEGIIRNVEPGVADEDVRAIVNNFADWERTRPAPQVFSSAAGAKVIETWLREEASAYVDRIMPFFIAAIVVGTVFTLTIEYAQRRLAETRFAVLE